MSCVYIAYKLCILAKLNGVLGYRLETIECQIRGGFMIFMNNDGIVKKLKLFISSNFLCGMALLSLSIPAASATDNKCTDLLTASSSTHPNHDIDQQVYALNLKSKDRFYYSAILQSPEGRYLGREIRYNQGTNEFRFHEDGTVEFIQQIIQPKLETRDFLPDLRPATEFSLTHEVRPVLYELNDRQSILSDVYLVSVKLPHKTHVIEVDFPREKGMEEVAKAVMSSLRMLPALHLDSITQIRINERISSVKPTHYAETFRSIIDIFPIAFDQFLSRSPEALHFMRHEYAHTISFKLWGKLNPPKGYIQTILKDSASISRYGDTNWVENFAEGMDLYLAVNWGQFNEQAKFIYPSRFAINDRIFMPDWKSWAEQIAQQENRETLPAEEEVKKIVVPPKTQWVVDHLRNSSSERDNLRYTAFMNLIHVLENYQFPSLEKGIQQAKLPSDILAKIQKESKGIMSVKDLVHTNELKDAFALGAAGRTPRWQYEIITEARQLKGWREAYREFGIDWQTDQDHTRHFLEKLKESGKPIVFLVPNEVLDFPRSEFTKKEFLMILKDPNLLKRTIFVFGAYNLFDDQRIRNLFTETRFSESNLNSLMLRVFGFEGTGTWDD